MCVCVCDCVCLQGKRGGRVGRTKEELVRAFDFRDVSSHTHILSFSIYNMCVNVFVSEPDSWSGRGFSAHSHASLHSILTTITALSTPVSITTTQSSES